jgi:hypothetical protein
MLVMARMKYPDCIWLYHVVNVHTYTYTYIIQIDVLTYLRNHIPTKNNVVNRVINHPQYHRYDKNRPQTVGLGDWVYPISWLDIHSQLWLTTISHEIPNEYAIPNYMFVCIRSYILYLNCSCLSNPVVSTVYPIDHRSHIHSISPVWLVLSPLYPTIITHSITIIFQLVTKVGYRWYCVYIYIIYI